VKREEMLGERRRERSVWALRVDEALLGVKDGSGEKRGEARRRSAGRSGELICMHSSIPGVK
jgi:hypothetical protein